MGLIDSEKGCLSEFIPVCINKVSDLNPNFYVGKVFILSDRGGLRLVYLDSMNPNKDNPSNMDLVFYDITGFPDDSNYISEYKILGTMLSNGNGISTRNPDGSTRGHGKLHDPGSLNSQFKYGIELCKLKEHIVKSIDTYKSSYISNGDLVFISSFYGGVKKIKEGKTLEGIDLVKIKWHKLDGEKIEIGYEIIDRIDDSRCSFLCKNIGDSGSIIFKRDKNIVTNRGGSSGSYSEVISPYIKNSILCGR